MFFPLFLITELYLLIPVVTAQILNPNAEVVILTRKPTKEAKADGSTPSNHRS